jgi:hypothetical protein
VQGILQVSRIPGCVVYCRVYLACAAIHTCTAPHYIAFVLMAAGWGGDGCFVQEGRAAHAISLCRHS